jgi:hypothetical protein
MATESPTSSWSPQENNLKCQTCGQLFSTAGRQKYVSSHLARLPSSLHMCDANLFYTLSRQSQTIIPSNTY